MDVINQAGDRISEYILEECVGAGTFGEVWRARHHVWDNDHVAIKLPTEPQYVHYLQREGIVVHGLRHPNIVKVQGLDPYAEKPYLVMELVDGPSLRQVIDEHPNGMPLEAVKTVLRGVLDALVIAHGAGVLHRDLKPGNVLLNLAQKPIEQLEVVDVKVSDFGLGVGEADTLRSIAQSASIARDEKLVGTLAYMAPEVRDGKMKPDAKSDLFAVGVMLFEMLTGARPAGAELPSTVRPDVAGLDVLFQNLYARYDRRHESAAAALGEFESLTQTAGIPPVPPVAPGRPGAAVGGHVRRCPDCGGGVEPQDQFCTQCGYQLVPTVRRCPACGAYPAPENRFCIFCGAALPTREEA